jgi:DNA-binding HxlR family transcriptional regulator
VARTLEIVGERWTLLIVRDAFLGLRRFDEFQRSLGIATNVLTARLEHLTEAGVMDKRRYQERPERYEYTLTDKGRDLHAVVAAMLRWGDRWASPVPPRLLTHRADGGKVGVRVTCEACGEEVERAEVESMPNPALAVVDRNSPLEPGTQLLA